VVVVLDPFDPYVRCAPLLVLMFPAPFPHTSDRDANDIRTLPSFTWATLRAMLCAGSVADASITLQPHAAAISCFAFIG
jgi:hypothetical protein